MKIIKIYDIYKNIITVPIQTDLFKDPIKINEILKKLNKKDIYFFKTSIEAFLINNKLNDVKYTINYNYGRFSYNFIHVNLRIFNKKCIICNNKKYIMYKSIIYTFK